MARRVYFRSKLMAKLHTCMISALAFATPEATVPIPTSDTSLTETFALGLTWLLIFVKREPQILKVGQIFTVEERYLMKVKDQLCQILYGINIMMWRWRYKRNSWFRVSKSSNICANFFPRKLATFTWLRSLSNFNFQLVCINQKRRSDTKTPWSNLWEDTRSFWYLKIIKNLNGGNSLRIWMEGIKWLPENYHTTHENDH